MRLRAKLLALVLIVLVVVIVTGGLLAYFFRPAPYSAAHDRDIGANVSVTGQSVPVVMKAVKTNVPNASFGKVPAEQFLQPLGPVVEVTPAGKLPAKATLKFKLTRQVKPNDTVYMATKETANSQWTLMPTVLSKDGWYASVQTDHLSWWQPYWYNVQAAAVEFKKLMTDSVNSLSGDLTTQAEKPECAKETEARQDDYLIDSSAKDTLFWCFGIEKDKRILKIVNRMHYPLEVTHLGFSSAHVTSPFQLKLDNIAQLVSGKKTILDPFEQAEYTLDLKPGGEAGLRTTFSGLAQSLYQLEFGVSLAAYFVGNLGASLGIGAKAGGSVKTFESVMKLTDDLLGDVGCANSAVRLDVADLMKECFDEMSLLAAFGWKYVLLLPLMVLSSTVEFFRSEYQAFVSQINHSDAYVILISRFDPTAALAPFVGRWGRHTTVIDMGAPPH